MEPPPPLVVVVTGGIASGKTAVTDYFAVLGVEVIDADRVARELVEPGQPALDEIVRRFGPVLDFEGRLDRAALRERIFADSGQRHALEAILHPRIRAALRERSAHAPGPYVVLAIPLLVESNHYDWVDRVLVVDVPTSLQRARVMRRDGIDLAAAERVLSAQASRQQRLAVADDVIVNDNGLDLLNTCVARLDARYRALAASRAQN